MRDRGPAVFEMDFGGQGNEEVTLRGIFPAPFPPVCHGRYFPLNGDLGTTPSAAHLPLEVRGSLGIATSPGTHTTPDVTAWPRKVSARLRLAGFRRIGAVV